MQCQPFSPETQDLHPLIAPVSPYAALIFDCDGTIADTLPVHCQSWQVAHRAGLRSIDVRVLWRNL